MGLLDEKIALITGAGQGVGQGIAYALAAEGACIAATGRTLSKVEATCAEITRRGGSAIALTCDVKEASSLEQTVGAVVEQFGTIDILINNAQEVPSGLLLDLNDDMMNAGWQSGPLATWRLMKLCHPYLKDGGNIINLGSAAGRRWDVAGYGAYAAVKEAIRSLSRAAACEWGIDGIRTNVILPHAKSTGLIAWMEANPEEAKAFQATIPMRRVGECEEDIGTFVAQLCSEGSRFITGQTIAVDGGLAFIG